MTEIESTVPSEGEAGEVELARTGTKGLPPELIGRSHDAETLETKVDRTATPGERQGISPRRLLIIVIGLCITIFLTALDQTIVSTAVPTIVEDLGDSSGYTWIGTSYLLASYSAP